jgi:hypothetical protein
VTAKLLEIEMCEGCAAQLWPAINAPQFDERVFIEAVARKLEQCPRCKHNAQLLREAGRRWGTYEAWAAVDVGRLDRLKQRLSDRVRENRRRRY